jgi:hypothetical protein
MMFETLGLDPDGQPREGWAENLFRQPASGLRYEPDLVRAQRQMRAETATPSSGGANAAVPRQARKIDQPTSLPTMLLPENEARAIDYRRQGIDIPAEWEVGHRAALAADPGQDARSGSRHPGTLESMIPIWGSGGEAYADYEDGAYLEAAGNAAMAASDAFLVKSILTGLAKGAVKGAGSHSWTATRKWMGKRGYLQPGQEGHHWAIPQGGWGKRVPDIIKNQPWNIKAMPPGPLHSGVHGKRPLHLNPLERAWHGSPAWPKAAAVSVGGRLVPDDEHE